MVYVFGAAVAHPVLDVTPTLLNAHTVAIAREADYWATAALRASRHEAKIAQVH